MKRRTIGSAAAVAFLLALSATPASAQFRREYIYSEAGRLLPKYCKSTQDGAWDPNSPYREVFGSGWDHLHHYCRALDNFHMAMKNWTDVNDRTNMLESALQNLDYVLTRTGPDFVLRPEILVKRGQVLLALDRESDALMHFNEARRIKSDYTPAYLMLSHYYLRKKDYASARKVLEEGIRNAGEDRVLREKLAELDSSRLAKKEP